MNDITSQQLSERVARVIDQAWPCYIHYADPRNLVGDDERIQWVLTQLLSTVPAGESSLPSVLPAPERVAESMVLGHEHHAACLALASALTRCIPALTHEVQLGRCPTFDREDQYTVRAALAAVHRRHHRLDPADEDDTPLIEALCTRTDRPLEVTAAWRYMVRLTVDEGMGAPLGAFDFMPMRCFTDLAHARNWSAMQAIWDCRILGEDGPDRFADERLSVLLEQITRHDGCERTWHLPFTHATLRFTGHVAVAADTAATSG